MSRNRLHYLLLSSLLFICSLSTCPTCCCRNENCSMYYSVTIKLQYRQSYHQTAYNLPIPQDYFHRIITPNSINEAQSPLIFPRMYCISFKTRPINRHQQSFSILSFQLPLSLYPPKEVDDSNHKHCRPKIEQQY